MQQYNIVVIHQQVFVDLLSPMFVEDKITDINLASLITSSSPIITPMKYRYITKTTLRCTCASHANYRLLSISTKQY